MDQHRWMALMKAWDWDDHLTTYHALVKAYGQKHRHYHNSAHIKATLKHLDQVTAYIDHPKELELALWFHDAIYRPFSATNEFDSAAWAKQFMDQNKASPAAIKRVDKLIMVTIHQAPPQTQDQAYMIDIDLAILGAPADLYASYEQWIRAEYRWVPGFVFRRKRKTLLNHFLQHQPIFQTNYFQQKYETKAVKNLLWAISKL